MFELTGPVVFTAADQQVFTEGLPTGDTRATLRIVAAGLTTAVRMRDRDFALLSNVIVDGNRTNLGLLGGDALIYAGGYSQGQIIAGNKIADPRSWSALQVIEGGQDDRSTVPSMRWWRTTRSGPPAPATACSGRTASPSPA